MTWWYVVLVVLFAVLIGIPLGKVWAEIIAEYLDERR